MYGKDMRKDLKGELSGNFENIVKNLFMDMPTFDAVCIRKAMKGAGTVRWWRPSLPFLLTTYVHYHSPRVFLAG